MVSVLPLLLARGRILVWAGLLAAIGLLSDCGENDERIMADILARYRAEIDRAVRGTGIPPAYLAALISLESYPVGNRASERFEETVYSRLLELKYTGRPYGNLRAGMLAEASDADLRRYSTSYGLTQIMGFHCLDLGCSIDDLRGTHHLFWAVHYILKHYGDRVKKKDWVSCFNIHNTGSAVGQTARRDYAERGVLRMLYYNRLLEREAGNF